jgi:hypothetical protein
VDSTRRNHGTPPSTESSLRGAPITTVVNYQYFKKQPSRILDGSKENKYLTSKTPLPYSPENKSLFSDEK